MDKYSPDLIGLGINAFDGDLVRKHIATAGGIGTYTRPSGGNTWTKQ